MKRWILVLTAAACALLAGSLPAYAQRLRGGVEFDYGTTSKSFGLSSPPYFDVPYQANYSSDGIVTGSLEYVVGRNRPLEVGIAFKASFAFSEWNLGTPPGGVYYVYSPDDVRVTVAWWALGGYLTARLHFTPMIALEGAFGYGPYGYLNANYADDQGIVSGPVVQSSSVFPYSAWGFNWSAGIAVALLPMMDISFDVGMLGPDWIAGFGVSVPL